MNFIETRNRGKSKCNMTHTLKPGAGISSNKPGNAMKPSPACTALSDLKTPKTRKQTPMTRSFQAITTKYLGPTNVKGSRIKATAAAGSLTIHIDHALNIEANHTKAAELLAHKYGWGGQWFMGGLPNDDGYCFVCTEDKDTLAFVTMQRG